MEDWPQRVVISDSMSSRSKVPNGVPRESFLLLGLFTIFINGVYTGMDGMVIKCADDKKLAEIANMQEDRIRVPKDLDMKDNELCLCLVWHAYGISCLKYLNRHLVGNRQELVM